MYCIWQGLSYSGGFTATSCIFWHTSNWCKNWFSQTKSLTSIIFKVKTCKNSGFVVENQNWSYFNRWLRPPHVVLKNRGIGVTKTKKYPLFFFQMLFLCLQFEKNYIRKLNTKWKCIWKKEIQFNFIQFPNHSKIHHYVQTI